MSLDLALFALGWLATGAVVARAWVAIQHEPFAIDYEASPARAGFNVVFWPLPLIVCVFMVVGWAAMKITKGKS